MQRTLHVETGLVDAIGDQYTNTRQWKVLNYKESIESLYRDKYQQGIDEEQENMINQGVYKVVHKKDVPKGTKILD